MSNKVRGLGRGLGALMGGAPAANELRKPVGYINKSVVGARPAGDADIMRIPVDQIEANPFQPRIGFSEEGMAELTESIRSLGLIQPITVRKKSSGGYQIISGERRYRACRQAGMNMIPAYVREADDQGMLEMALVENIQRMDLDPVETALGYRRLMEECSFTQEQLSLRLGKNRATVANTLRLLKLPVKVQHDLKEGLISTGHAKALLGTDSEAVQEQLCDLIITRGLSVREVESMVRSIVNGMAVPGVKSESPARSIPKTYDLLAGQMRKYFSKDINYRRTQAGKGSITIRFSSDKEVEKFLAALDSVKL